PYDASPLGRLWHSAVGRRSRLRRPAAADGDGVGTHRRRGRRPQLDGRFRSHAPAARSAGRRALRRVRRARGRHDGRARAGRVAAELERVVALTGDVIVREGDVGDRFYLIDQGSVAVSIAAQPVRRLGPGEFFGEIALVRGVPRTATVIADGDVRLYALRRAE